MNLFLPTLSDVIVTLRDFMKDLISEIVCVCGGRRGELVGGQGWQTCLMVLGNLLPHSFCLDKVFH